MGCHWGWNAGAAPFIPAPCPFPCFYVQGMNAADLVKPKYTGIMQTVLLVSKEEGPAALWKGNGE